MWYFEKHRLHYYKKLQKHAKSEYKKIESPPVKFELVLDLISILIMSHTFKSKADPLFDSVSPFTKAYIKKYSKCIPNYHMSIQVLLKFNDLISEKYLKYYSKMIDILSNKPEQYEFTDEIVNETYVVINCSDEETNSIKLPMPLFTHLVRLYNTHEGDYTNIEVKEGCLEKIFIVYNRYKIFSSGNNQASILPSVKLKIKNLLNIKTELFGSPLNTSNYSFGSIFYDIDKYFGSLGNFFDIDLSQGYYEANPIFDKCVITKMVDKILESLKKANKNKKPLLFLIIIPLSYGNKVKKTLADYLKYYYVSKKFKYLRFSRDFSKTNVSTITITQVIVAATEHVSTYVKYNYDKLQAVFEKNE